MLLEKASQVARTDTQTLGELFDVSAVQGALGNQFDGVRDDRGRTEPRRAPRRGIRPAPLARPEPSGGCRSSGAKPNDAIRRSERNRANRPAIDSGGSNSGKEAAVKALVTAMDGLPGERGVELDVRYAALDLREAIQTDSPNRSGEAESSRQGRRQKARSQARLKFETRRLPATIPRRPKAGMWQRATGFSTVGTVADAPLSARRETKFQSPATGGPEAKRPRQDAWPRARHHGQTSGRTTPKPKAPTPWPSGTRAVFPSAWNFPCAADYQLLV